MAYDAHRDRVVMFGGQETASTAVTWEWDGTRWLSAALGGPAQRRGTALAYDPVRQRVVMFGGIGTTPMPETWEWDGQSWSIRATTGPAPRSDHAMAYDATSGRIIMFGGVDGAGSFFRETWSWDGASWSLISTIGPSARAWHAMATDPQQGIVLFGGSTFNFVFADTWRWDGVRWHRLFDGVPTARFRSAFVYDEAHGVAVLIAGRTDLSGTRTAESWHWNGLSWTPGDPFAAGPRSSVSSAYDSHRGRIVTYGGDGSSDTWSWDATSWTQLAATPRVGNGYSIVYDTARDEVLVFGGPTGETWIFDGTRWTRRAVPGPSPRRDALTTYDTARARVVLYGGVGPPSLADTWEWDGASWTQVATGNPAPFVVSDMAYDPQRQRTVLFGTWTVGRDETWEWDGVAWTMASNVGPHLPGCRLAFDGNRQRVLLFNINNFGQYPQTLDWNGATWNPVALDQGGASVPLSGARSIVFADSINRLVLFAQRPAPSTDSAIWLLDGSRWSLYGSTPPIWNSNDAMVWDNLRHRMVLFGFGSTASETWQFTPTCPLPADLNHDGAVDLGDLAILLRDFGCDGSAGACSSDIDGDGVVGLPDLAQLLTSFGTGC